ncbi:HAD-IA family hydrolase [Paracoccus tegillarcae]|uniref:HAD family hydrolase n=1 Tax=Paracoccus tegillarcae TaxID=1529068 RepID=A0A2K9EWZ4_9RHOB|nr:HAD-IA family hydrolase [Paracoccus tegillarcae]AUH32582.1 HAD family hydrolase [Paracoccus tegillarcae]
MKLFVFDVDGTLVDSQHHIHAAMTQAFQAVDLPPLALSQVVQIVGLSLPEAMAVLAPTQDAATQARLVQEYKNAFNRARITEDAPLYPGALDCLDALAARDDWLLAVATGKSRRGLHAMIEAHGLQGRFVSLQAADDHPSKPHPSMLLAALAETGLGPEDAVMIGDTSFDMQMSRAAGMAGFGVSWGYHDDALLTEAGARLIATDFNHLTDALKGWAA